MTFEEFYCGFTADSHGSFSCSPQKGRTAPPRSTMASLCSWRHAHGFANLMKAMVGSGLLTLPWATAQVGVVVSVVGLALIAFLTQYAIRLLVRCLVAVNGAELIATTAPRSDGSAATSSHGRSWEKISEAAFGAPGVAISLAFLVSAQLGVCASYLAFFATQLHDHGLFSSVRVAVLGSSGSGKSTILALLLRFYNPAAGRITLDGDSLAELSAAELRRRVAVVPQEPPLLSGSIRSNIAYGVEASDAEVEAVFEAYVTELRGVFDAHKDACLPPDVAARGLTVIRREDAKSPTPARRGTPQAAGERMDDIVEQVPKQSEVCG